MLKLKTGYKLYLFEFRELPVGQVSARLTTGADTQIHHRLLLTDENELEVRPPDIGIGISQVIPVLVLALDTSDGLIAIEQPELHLHPALQAELGDLFIESSSGVRQNTLLIETHSEHLILRLMRRMRDTYNASLPPGLPAIHPEDVAVVHVQSQNSYAMVRILELDEEGHLLDPFPGGFFEEGFRERFS
jgi:predicted ATPase